MKNNYSVTQVLAFHSLPKPNPTQHGVVRAIQNLERKGQPAYLGSIAREMGKKEGSVCQSIKDLRLGNYIKEDIMTTGDYGKQVTTYKLVYKGQENLI